jgi:hypothetical protein
MTNVAEVAGSQAMKVHGTPTQKLAENALAE